MNDTCSWPGCTTSQGCCIDGALYCSLHYPQKLREVVRAGIREGIDDRGRCEAVPGWINRFARLVTDDDGLSTGGLTKAKIERRGYEFSSDGQHVQFSIDRHPAGRVCAQQWEFSAETGELKLLGERIVSADFPVDENGVGHCRKCGIPLRVTPGRVKCLECGFETQHEHTLDPW